VCPPVPVQFSEKRASGTLYPYKNLKEEREMTAIIRLISDIVWLALGGTLLWMLLLG
jgi:hypothetical protein